VPLRLRLTLTYGLLLVLALTAFGFVVYLIAAARIYEGIDETLTTRAGLVVAALEPLDGALSAKDIEANRAQLDRESSLVTVTQVRDRDGLVLYSSPAPNRSLPPSKSPSETRFLSRKVQGQRLRILYQPLVQEGESLGTVEVGQSLREADEALNEIRYVLLFGGLGVVFITIVSAYALSARALDPVRQVSKLARDIERTADFSRRLPAPGAGGEMRELVATFNAMIARVEATLVSQLAFLADSSHELRRPLTVLRTNIDVLKEPALSAEDREACLAEMRAEAEAMSRLLSDLLLLSRDKRQAIAQSPVDYTSLCEQAVDRVRSQDDRHELLAELTPDIRVIGDKERLGQMLWNLLENALHYTPAGGRIEISLQEVGRLARVEIRDTGVGISDEEMPHVFERFYRGQTARTIRSEGAGLGLAIVKYVAEAHGGEVRMTSRPDQGTAVVVDIPAAV
jgi:two-component system, OmpR family, sensor kinase